ncbi:MAG: phenylacetate--CoA ligase family protein [Myxococcales bacterium]|nr:phenylacetate--CoA ligase family protein [Myxococcales bacterium]
MPARSSLRGVAWPAIPDPAAARVQALAWQLDQSQWWSPARLAAHQDQQLAELLRHAATSPHYQATFAAAGCAFTGAAPTADAWARVPIASRAELVAAGDALLSRAYPAQHGAVHDVLTSRTTGAPVRLRATDLMASFWNAITLRDRTWHRRDLTAHLAAIRHVADGGAPPDGDRARGWGPATAPLAPDAPLSRLSIAATIDAQVAWLVRADPTYLLIYPSALDAVVRRLAATGQRLPSLAQVRTISEALAPATRAACAEVLGVPVVDTYSAQEVGYVALQCPDHAHYHVVAERLRVEILDDDGQPCPPGATGRVVVTDLHNFATPVIRYELGDYAEVGAPCPCGRGLPVLTRVVGRRRGLVSYPDGRRAWPVFTVACRAAARYRELQLVQDTVDALRLRIVPEAGPLTPAERAALVAALQRALAHPFAIAIEEVPELGRSPAGKLEEFVSHVPA